MNSIIALALPGALALITLRIFRRDRSRAGWDHLLLAGLLGAASFFTARLPVIFGLYVFPDLAVAAKLHLIRAFGPIDYIGTYLLSFLVAPLAAYGFFAASRCVERPAVKAALKKTLGVRHFPGEINPLVALFSLQGPVIASLDSGQVYIGLIKNSTLDPEDEHKLVILQVLLSGRRSSAADKERFVTYSYATPYESEPENQKFVFVDLENVITISEFTIDNFMRTIAKGYSRIDREELRTFFMALELAGYSAQPAGGDTAAD